MYRNIELIIYNYERVLDCINICNNNNFDYAFILHDCDLKDNGDVKKGHYHFQVYYCDKKSLSAWSKIFNCNVNDIEKIKDKKSAIRYLIHCDNNEKFHYDYSEIVSNIDLSNYFREKSDENFDIKLITDYIKSHCEKILFCQLKDFVLENNLWGSYRRSYSIIRDLVIEHNNMLTNNFN